MENSEIKSRLKLERVTNEEMENSEAESKQSKTLIENTWQLSIKGLARRLSEVIFLWTLESPRMEKQRCWDMVRLKLATVK